MADERRVNMYFSDKKYIDNTIFEYFKDMPNEQDIMKMVLYEYVTSKNAASNKFVTEKAQKGVVTKTAPKKPKNVKKKKQELPQNITKLTQNSETFVTKNTQEEHSISTKVTPISDSKVNRSTQNCDSSKSKIEEKKNKLLAGLSYFNNKNK